MGGRLHEAPRLAMPTGRPCMAARGEKMPCPQGRDKGSLFTCQMRHPTTSLATTLSPTKLGAAPGSMRTLSPTGPATVAPTACVRRVPHAQGTELVSWRAGKRQQGGWLCAAPRGALLTAIWAVFFQSCHLAPLFLRCPY